MTLFTDQESTSTRTIWIDSLRQQLTRGVTTRVSGVPFLARRARLETSQNAGSYVKCELGDQTGWIDAIWWDAGKMDRADLQSILVTAAWIVDGVASLNRFGNRETPQIKIERVRIDGTDPLDIPGLVRRSVLSDEELRQWLSDTIATIRNRPLRSLLEDNLGEGSCWRREYLRVPAGLHYHHAYLGGLADHVREMAEVWQSSVSTFPRVDRDLTLGGILLHDIGKLDTFSSGAMPQIAESGRYMDHITAGIGRLTPGHGREARLPAPVARPPAAHPGLPPRRKGARIPRRTCNSGGHRGSPSGSDEQPAEPSGRVDPPIRDRPIRLVHRCIPLAEDQRGPRHHYPRRFPATRRAGLNL
ncbi:MAG TPA: hypothetical protein VHS06_00980, partial [Chloroflexota bacterium]|nr:hypothetical protein [Chloroflexota bacterium]